MHSCDPSAQGKDKDCGFGSSLGYIERSCLKKEKEKKRKEREVDRVSRSVTKKCLMISVSSLTV